MYEQVERPKENKSRAVANSVAQKKNNTKQGFGFVDNRVKEVLQKKDDKDVIQCGGKMSIPAATKTMPTGSAVYRATTQSPMDLARAGGMTRLVRNESIPTYRIPLYMVFTSSNPGVISTARTRDAAMNFGMALQDRNREKGIHDTMYIYKIDAFNQRAIDMEKAVPKVFRWLYGAEEEEMIMDDIPKEKIELLMKFGTKEDSSEDSEPPK